MATTFLSSICTLATKFSASLRNSQPSSSSAGALDIVNDLEKLQRTLQRIQAVLRDAEEREIREESIRWWLKELKEVAYDADDVLDEYQYESRRVESIQAELEAVEEASNKKRKRELHVSEHLTCVLSALSFPERIRCIRERFGEIAKDRNALHLQEGDGVGRREDGVWPLPTSSHVDESGIFGRENDRDEVIELLLTDDNRRFSVVPIVGMGGIGKTTLAQLVFNDTRIQQTFDSVAWVCVSDNFQVARLTNEVIESITRQSCNLKQLNSLQDALKQKVNGKRVFIVLDDVWNEQQEPWESFCAPFIGAETVKILVTTRNDSVARIIQTVPPFRPGFLDHDQCWSLFKHHAFGGQNLDEYPRLVKIGCRIIEKCGYLPLSVKSIGSLLRYEFDEERWMEILESDLWDLDLARKCILPALMLSYHHLPSHLKPCFLYSSMFPKDYRFERDRLVKLWIAQGFIVPRVNRSLEDIGNNYFDELLGRSFFQLSYGSACNLHDAIHDLARSIAGGEYYAVRLEGESLPLNISKEVRHLYVEFVDGKATVELLSFKAPSSVRTLIVEPPFFWDPDDVNYNFGNLDHLGGLRVIEMQHKYFCSSATNLKHLRYLSVCGFERDERFKFDIALPESSVHHLQTLPTLDTTFSCRPQSIIYHLSNLFHLRFLKLSLSDHGGFVGCINVADEKMSKFLCKRRCFCPPVSFTEIVITGICYLPCNPSLSNWEEGRFTDAAFPRLAKITFMYTAELRSIAVLPFSSLKCLKIRSCNKLTSLPCLQVLAHLQELHLQHCVQLQLRQQESLPPSLRRVHISDCPSLRMVAGLQKLTSLRSLELRGCPNLRFLSHDGLPLKPQNVVIVDCPKLREWCKKIEFEYIQDEVIKELTLHDYSEFNGIPGSWISIDDSSLSSDEWLPSTLQTLEVRSLKILNSITLHQNLTLLRRLIIKDCMNLTSVMGMHNLNSLTYLAIMNCPQLLHLSPNEQLPSSLYSLIITDCRSLISIPLFHHNMSSFNLLKLSNCSSLKNVRGLCSLNFLSIIDVPQLLHLSPNEQLTPSLQSLTITDSTLLHLSPSEHLPSSLHSLTITDSPSLTSIDLLHQNIPSLEVFDLSYCSNLKDVWGLHSLCSLKHLTIRQCPQLLHLSPDVQLPPSLQSLKITHCKSLISIDLLHQNIPSLEVLNLSFCWNLKDVWGLHNLCSLKHLTIRKCLQLLHLSPNEQLPPSLHSLKITDCRSLISVPLFHHNMPSFELLKLSHCSSLKDVRGLHNVPTLHYSTTLLQISDCPELQSIRHDEQLNIKCPLQLELVTPWPYYLYEQSLFL